VSILLSAEKALLELFCHELNPIICFGHVTRMMHLD